MTAEEPLDLNLVIEGLKARVEQSCFVLCSNNGTPTRGGGEDVERTFGQYSIVEATNNVRAVGKTDNAHLARPGHFPFLTHVGPYRSVHWKTEQNGNRDGGKHTQVNRLILNWERRGILSSSPVDPNFQSWVGGIPHSLSSTHDSTKTNTFRHIFPKKTGNLSTQVFAFV